MAFQYGRALSGTAIRLLHFVEDSHEQLHSMMLEVDEHELESAPQYHALSYTWGPPLPEDPAYTPADLIPICIGNQTFKVLPNLFNALQHLAKCRYAKYYWIDAICINQNDITEREHQVSMMDLIYKTAQQVDIWLGSIGSSEEDLRPLLEKLARLEETMWDDNVDSFIDFADDDAMIGIGLPCLDERQWNIFLRFLSRTWFGRCWILQEVALARNAVILWEHDILEWELMAKASRYLFVTGLIRILLTTHLPSGQTTVIGITLNNIGYIRFFCKFNKSEIKDLCTGLFRFASGYKPGTNILAHMFSLFIGLARFFHVSDKRDYVYSLLGLLNHLSAITNTEKMTISPNYAIDSTPSSVFTEAALSIINGCDNLQHLTAITDKANRKVSDLPTWVSDLTSAGPNPMYSTYRLDMSSFDASLSPSSDDKSFWVQNRQLHTRGHCVGTITLTGGQLTNMAASGEFEQTIQMLLRCSQPYASTGQDRIDVFWRTMIFDRDVFHYPASPELARAFGSWLRNAIFCEMDKAVESSDTDAATYLAGLESLDELAASDDTDIIPSRASLPITRKIVTISDEEVNKTVEKVKANADFLRGFRSYQTLAFNTTAHRRLFLTDRGHMGTGPHSLQAGDLVYIVPDCNVPLILRRVTGESHLDASNNAGAEEQKFELMGEAYVHGIMHGEAVDENTTWNWMCLV